MRGRILPKAFLGSLLVLAAAPALAQTFPDRPIQFVVGYAPGGSIDTLGRIVANELSEKYPKGVVVENRAGADGAIAANFVAHATPDGHTIFVASNSLAINTLQDNRRFDPIVSFEPIILAASVPNVLVVSTKLTAVNSLQDLVAVAKAKPNGLTAGNAGAASPAYLETQLLMQQAGIEMVQVPYKGIAPALTDLAGGSLDVMFASVTSALPLIDSKLLKPIAISTAYRSPLMPDVPPVADSLHTNFDEPGTWVGLMAPAGTPREIVQKISGDVTAILKQQKTVEHRQKLGFVPLATPGPEFREFVKAEIAKAAQLADVLKANP